MADLIFRFVQIEVPWPLGPEDGRYVVRPHAGEQPEHVLVLATLGAPQRRLLRGRRARSAAPTPDPSAVPTGRATVIPTTQLASPDAAAHWLKGAAAEDEVATALTVLNAALHAHRLAVADPLSREVGRDDALVVRLGFGAGEQVAEGRWSEAVEVPRPKTGARRTAALRPQERLAALLSGRDAMLACELLTLRARADVNAGREREAALQLRAALETALAELPAWAERGDLAERVQELTAELQTVQRTAATALQRGLDPEEAETTRRVLARLEAALRARSAAGFSQ